MLEIRNLEIGYERLAEVVRGVSLTVGQGSIVTLLGPNGAGKTTILRAVSGLLDIHDGEVRKGQVILDGADVTGAPAARMVRSGVTLVPEGRQVFDVLTVEENLRSGAHTRRRDPQEVEESLAEVFTLFPPLEKLRRRTAGYLSGGEQQMLAIGRALMARPRLLLLDEPSLGLAPKVVEEICRVLVEINRRGTSVLLVEQNALIALRMAHDGYVLENGRIVLDGPSDRLLANDDIREFYLGLHPGGERRSYREIKHYRRRKRWLS
ncbi:MAG: ABC transporter ATP-binding protein [Acidimicrobiia bacterium]|nr:ABC transporter ATP-binding protein [Acidimicrobiia bacterium]